MHLGSGEPIIQVWNVLGRRKCGRDFADIGVNDTVPELVWTTPGSDNRCVSQIKCTHSWGVALVNYQALFFCLEVAENILGVLGPLQKC